MKPAPTEAALPPEERGVEERHRAQFFQPRSSRGKGIRSGPLARGFNEFPCQLVDSINLRSTAGVRIGVRFASATLASFPSVGLAAIGATLNASSACIHCLPALGLPDRPFPALLFSALFHGGLRSCQFGLQDHKRTGLKRQSRLLSKHLLIELTL